MTGSARALLDSVHRELVPAEDDNRLVPLVREGRAPRSVLASLAAEEHRIVRSDQKSFLTLAAMARETPTRDFFAGLAQGEGVALKAVPVLADALGMDEDEVRAYQPRAGCQAYPAFLAWLAMNAEPAEAAVAITTNFAAWGSYCAGLAEALRAKYGLDDAECAFFDFFASPPPGAQEQAVVAVQAGLDAGRVNQEAARRYAHLFQSYELMFWNTLAEQV